MTQLALKRSRTRASCYSNIKDLLQPGRKFDRRGERTARGRFGWSRRRRRRPQHGAWLGGCDYSERRRGRPRNCALPLAVLEPTRRADLLHSKMLLASLLKAAASDAPPALASMSVQSWPAAHLNPPESSVLKYYGSSLRDGADGLGLFRWRTLKLSSEEAASKRQSMTESNAALGRRCSKRSKGAIPALRW